MKLDEKGVFMIDFNEPVLADKQRADAIFYNSDYRACDYCFGNLFIWRKKYKTRIAFLNGFLLTNFEGYGRKSYLFPAGKGDLKFALQELAKDAKGQGNEFSMACLTPSMCETLEELFPGKFNFVPDRSNFDYIYNSDDLINLSGKKYHGKRNHITRFKNSCEWSFEELNQANIEECEVMNDEWCKANGCGKEIGLREEYCAVSQAFKNYTALGFTGGVLRQYGKVIAFTIGERLCTDTFVVHIEKAFGEIEGAYPMINNAFVTQYCDSYQYVNREDDTGDEGLRKAKLSYHPVILLEKSTAVLKEGATL